MVDGRRLNTKAQDWSTPAFLIQALELEFGRFQLDPCASDWNAKAKRYFTEEDDGLSKAWDSGPVFMNPPWENVLPWVCKAWKTACEGITVVCLLPSRTGRGWFLRYSRLAENRFLRHRVKFERQDGVGTRPPEDSLIMIFREVITPYTQNPRGV